VRWPPACEDVSPGAKERPLLSQLRIAFVRSEKLVDETGGQFGNPEEGERPLLEAATKQRIVWTEYFICAVFTVISGVCNSMRLS
jgi:hypothetical protein